MFYEYAITPEVFDPAHLAGNGARGVILTQLLRGLCDNGMIADLHKGAWDRKIAEKVSALSQQQTRDELIKLLSTLKDRNRVVRHPKAAEEPKSDIDWLGLACEANGRAALDAIILSSDLHAKSARNDDLLSPFDSVLDAAHWQGRRRSVTIKQCEADYRALLPPILRHAKRLYLIDPYLRPHRRKSSEIIRICASLLGERGSNPLSGVIEVHTGDPNRNRTKPMTVAEEMKEWSNWKQKSYYPHFARHPISIHMWADDDQLFRDRFLVTDQVGFLVGHGFDCEVSCGTASETPWTLLEEPERQSWLSKFQPGASPYRKISPSP